MSPADTSIDGESSNNNIASVESSVQSSLFNERPASSSNTDVSSALSGGKGGGNTGNLRKSASKTKQQPKLLSRNPKVIITTSARGNLGPPSVLNQDPPGKDWIEDRWQAASDMGGTAIEGSHWVLLDFSQLLIEDEKNENGMQMTKIVLDWETAYATDYRVEGRMDRPTNNNDSSSEDDWCVLYDGANNNNLERHQRNEVYGMDMHLKQFTYGQSPGVKQKLPLHIVHTIEWTQATPQIHNEQSSEGDGSTGSNSSSCQATTAFKYLRIFIRKPARGWGVSLWEVDVYGTIVNS